METLEVHSKDFLVKWIKCTENSVINWQVKPIKRSINFAIYYKHEDSGENALEKQDSATGSCSSGSPQNPTFSASSDTELGENIAAPRIALDDLLKLGRPRQASRVRSDSTQSVQKITDSLLYRTRSSRSSTLSLKFNKPGLTLVRDYGRLIANEVVRGDVTAKEGGVYAFVFDNSFSKTIGKKVNFSCKISTGSTIKLKREDASQVDNSTISSDQAFNTACVTAAAEATAAVTAMTSPQSSDRASLARSNNDTDVLSIKNGELLQGILLKRRRKRLQGLTKRFFVLNFKYGVLSYFKLNDNKLRGQMPITRSIVSANSKTRQIFIDSGMEAWELKAPNNKSFQSWVEAFNQAKKLGDHAPTATAVSSDPIPQSRAVSFSQEDLVQVELQAISNSLEEILRLNRSDVSQQAYKSIEQVSHRTDRLLKRVHSYRRPNSMADTMSIYSSSVFYDAQDFSENDGVVLINSQQEDQDSASQDFSDEKSVSSSSSGDMSMDLGEGVRSIKTVRPRFTSQVEVSDLMYPLPHEPVERDCDIPSCLHAPPSFIGIMRKNVGKDLSTIAMPVEMNEPIGILQRYAEMFEYAHIIDVAILQEFSEGSGEKILRIAAFAVSYLSSLRAKERSNRKPFNPLLGETFELVREDFDMRMIGEKVLHRPAVFAFYADTPTWKLSFSPAPSQKFWGKNAEVATAGEVCLTVKATGEMFLWSHPNTLLKNIIAGEKYSEPSSQIIVKCTDGSKAIVDFAKGGMFSGRSEDLTIKAYGPSKQELSYTVYGKWTESMILKANTAEKIIWNAGSLLPDFKSKFGFSEFTGTLNKITEMEAGYLPPTDSRLRPDMRAYERGYVAEAEELKIKLEEEQRVRRQELETQGKAHQPQFFKKSDKGTGPAWTFVEGSQSYWSRRERQDWDGLLALW